MNKCVQSRQLAPNIFTWMTHYHDNTSDDITSGSSPLKMYMRVFSIIANMSGLSSAQQRSQTSLRSSGNCLPICSSALARDGFLYHTPQVNTMTQPSNRGATIWKFTDMRFYDINSYFIAPLLYAHCSPVQAIPASH